MATIIIKPSRNNAIARRARKRTELIAAKRHEKAFALRLDNTFMRLSGCLNRRVFNAVNDAKHKLKSGSGSGTCCLPEVARYAAGYRKLQKVTAR